MPNHYLVKEQKFEGKPNDIVIAVMGPTGAGKSNLIEHFHATDSQQKLQIAKEQLKSATSAVSVYRVINHESYQNRVVLVDTPGFDDTHISDMAVLKMIGDWLEGSYRKGKTLTGILYLHRMTDNRMTGTANRNLRMFGQLCGNDAAQKVILVTTMWDRMKGKDEVAKSRVDQLRGTYWKEFLEMKSRIEPFNNTTTSADLILARVIERANVQKVLHLQEELVNLGKPIKETDAGITLYSTLQRILKEQRETLDALMNEQATQADPALLATLAEQRKQIEHQLQQSLKDLEQLKVGFFQRLFAFLRFKKALSRAISVGEL
ncbi:hypothetical protein CVT24_010983 [Panaeolus cyanescens]|uniref:G domain-containing protein n=1 Tax=Panaeolus cyanescens TaxID=181874 RepID=A0A409YVR3_9AGAR|nr:hypothetical protein CVT24_010983 [Panaeolus cyanescens]